MKTPIFKMPPLQDFQTIEMLETAREFWLAGILKPPFKKVIFITKYQADETDSPTILRIHVAETGSEGHYTVRQEVGVPGNDVFKWLPYWIEIKGPDAVLHIPDGDDEIPFFPNEATKKEKMDQMAHWICRVMWSCVMVLNMKHFDQEEVIISEKLQKARAKRGKPPLENYVQVSLNKACRAMLLAGAGTDRSVSPHWRRGHIRHLQSGKAVPVMPCMVNWRGEDIEPKDYKIKTGD